LEHLAISDSRAVRHLLGLTYHADSEVRQAAAKAVAVAGRHHPKVVRTVIRRLIWAMSEESGTNSTTAPAVLQAIADEQPELLVPMVPDLMRSAADGGNLQEGLAAALRTVAKRCPGEVGRELAAIINEQRAEGECCGEKA
jgi:hypothetical protein